MAIRPSSKVLDAPFEMDMGPGQGIWRPENFEKGKFLGDTTLRRGVELSRNVMTVRLADQLGHGQGRALSRSASASMTSCRRCLANSLGAYETTLIRMVTGYSEFVNGGKKITASLIDRIQDRNGRTIWRHDARDCEGCNDAAWHDQQEPLLADTREQVIDPRTAYQIVSILEGVVQRGTGRSVQAVGKPLAGKTGTSSDSQSVWFIGFSPDLAAGVLCRLRQSAHPGQGRHRRGRAGRHRGGADLPRFHERRAGRSSRRRRSASRPGIEEVPVNGITGEPVPPGTPGAIMEAFKAGTAPGEANAPVGGVIGADDGGLDAASTGRAGTAASARPAQQHSGDIGEGTGGLY